MQDAGEEPRLFPNRFADAVGPAGTQPDRDRCRCVGHSAATRPASVKFHPERQDTTCEGWQHLLALIDEAATDGRQVFTPFVNLSPVECRQIVTLPATIGTLTEVKHLVLYGTNLVRIPPQIGALTGLEVFEPYTSHRLHWFPYELTRCTLLRDSTVSTRALYGNRKHRPPFPALRAVTTTTQTDFAALDPGVWGTDAVSTCSACAVPVVEELHRAWITLPAGTDVLPFLVNACSKECLDQLPPPAPGYAPAPHLGGPALHQPTP